MSGFGNREPYTPQQSQSAQYASANNAFTPITVQLDDLTIQRIAKAVARLLHEPPDPSIT